MNKETPITIHYNDSHSPKTMESFRKCLNDAMNTNKNSFRTTVLYQPKKGETKMVLREKTSAMERTKRIYEKYKTDLINLERSIDLDIAKRDQLRMVVSDLQDLVASLKQNTPEPTPLSDDELALLSEKL